MMSQGTDCVLDVFVKEERVERVKHYIEHVQKLYCVAAQFTSAVGKQCMLSPGCWIDVEGKRENVVKAREYLKGLAQPEEVVRLRFPAPVYDLICGKDGQLLFDLERESAANIVFYSSEEVEISGWIAGVTKASSVIEDVIKNFIKENSTTDHADDDYEGADSLASVEEDSGIFMKCNLESESEVDIDTCDFNQSSALSPDECLDNQSCESLASDLSEVKDSKCTVCHQPSTQADTELMEYAKKLGYSEGQVKSAMKKLAADTIDQNELLHELIKASNSIRDGKIIGENGKADLSAIQSFYASVSEPPVDANSLKHIVVDGSNVAMSHGKNQTFSCRGIALCVDWFQKRGHNVTVFVPNWRKEASKPDTPITDQDILLRLSDEGILSFTPSRRIQGKLIQCYDDRFVVRLAVEHDGVIVSNDHFRDVQRDFPEWKDFIQKRLLMYTFAGDVFMPPDDPLGRHGPSLDDFLRKNVEPRGQQYCPYGRKCTFGPKCKFYHPDSRRHSGIFIKKPLPPLPREGSGGSSRPRSDPCHQSDPRRDGSRQRPASLPNLEQLYISPPHSLHKFIYHQSSQPVSHSHGRPVSGPPFPDNADAHYLLSSAGDVQTQRCRSTTDMYVPQQKQVNLQRKLSGDVSLVSPAVLQPPFISMHPPNRRPPSGEFIAHTLQPGVDFAGRPLSSEYGSRPSSGEYSYSSGSRPPSGEYMRPMSGEFNGSRPSSGDYGTPPWSYQRQVAFPNAIINQYPERNFYPVKGYYKTRGPPMPETKEEPRQHPNGLKIELVEQLRTLFPDLYDKILYVLRTYPNITCVEDAIPLLK